MRKRYIALAAFVAIIAAACLPSGFTVIDAAYTGVRITADGAYPAETFDLSAAGDKVKLSAPSGNQSWNLRASFFPTEQTPTTNGNVCATWTGPNAPDDLPQQGLAVRLETNPIGTRRAITITKNIFSAPGWTVQRTVQMINVNLWTITQVSGERDTVTLQNIALDFSDLLGTPTTVVPFPWTVCVRVGGPYVAVDIETAANPHVAFADSADYRAIALPSGWEFPGQFGWYVGHLPGGMTFEYENLTAPS